MKVGDYVRTKYGISKIISNPNTNKFNIDIFKKDGITLRCIRQKDIIKSSPNIIDLIEVGDYVNGGKVYEKEKEYIVINADFGRLFEFMCIYEKNIKSIVTREQFSQMEYKVKE